MATVLPVLSLFGQASVSVDPASKILKQPVDFFIVNSNYLDQAISRDTLTNVTAGTMKANTHFTSSGPSTNASKLQQVGPATFEANVTNQALTVLVGTLIAGEAVYSDNVQFDQAPRLTVAPAANSLLKGDANGIFSWGKLLTPEITDGVVTYAKIQNVTTQKLLGRATAGSGVVEEITLGSGLTLDAGTGVLTAAGGGGSATNAIANNNGLGTNTTLYGLFTVTGGQTNVTWLTVGGFLTNVGDAYFLGQVTGSSNITVLGTNITARLRVTEGAATGKLLSAVDNTGLMQFVDPASILLTNYVANLLGNATNLTTWSDTTNKGLVEFENQVDFRNNVNFHDVVTFDQSLSLSSSLTVAGEATIQGMLVADAGVEYVPVNVTGTIIDAAAGPFQYKVLGANTTLTLSNFTVGRWVHFAVTNPAAYTVTITGLNATNYNSAVGLPVATTNGLSEYLFINRSGAIEASFKGKELQDLIGVGLTRDTNAFSLTTSINLAPGANITFTTNGSQISIAGAAAAGEANTLSSLGSGWPLPTSKSGVDLRMNSVTNDATLTSASNANTITFGIAANGVGNTQLRDSGALSVIGRTANSTGDPSDIQASAVGQVLRYAGTTLGFGALDLADSDAITGNLPVTALDSGTGASGSTFWRGDGTWAAATGSGIAVNNGTGTNLTHINTQTNYTTGTPSSSQSSIFNKWFGYTNNANSSLTAPFGLTLTAFINASGTRSNMVWSLGPNPMTDGNKFFNTEPSVVFNFETHYNPSGTPQVELYPRMDPMGTSLDWRPWMATLSTNGLSRSFVINSDGLSVLDNTSANLMSAWSALGSVLGDGGRITHRGDLVIEATPLGLGGTGGIRRRNGVGDEWYNSDNSRSYFVGFPVVDGVTNLYIGANSGSGHIIRFSAGEAWDRKDATLTTGSYTNLPNDRFVYIPAASTRTNTLMDSRNLRDGQLITVVDGLGHATATNIVIKCQASGQKINGATTVSITNNFGSLTFQVNGTNFSIVASYKNP